MIRRLDIHHNAVLSDISIKKLCARKLLFDNELIPDQIQPNSVDIRLGNTYKRILPNKYHNGFIDSKYEQGFIDTKSEILYETGVFSNSDIGEHITIYPKEFMLMNSIDVLNIPNGILAFVQGRSSIARLGIQTEQAGLIDTGFHGTITFEVYNQTNYPIRLYTGMRFAQVYFFNAQYADVVYGEKKKSKYNGQHIATGSRIHLD